ncbi:hypothetical protein ACFYXH_13745 [Streptomyces sp. NPDC002730]|uniref:hypothetical protein n=1 Tax=Streptomyces sp. NPDC002730 TaxID=3364662 RepID=UPI00368D7143
MTLAPFVEPAPAARPHPRRWAGLAVLSASPLLEIRLFRSRPFTAGAVVAVTTAMARPR